MSQSYEDIINLPHPISVRHPRMPRISRAAQFLPFAALTGHEAAIIETARLTEQILLGHVTEQPEIAVTWFQSDVRKEGGQYITTVGRLKRIDEAQRMLWLTNGEQISLDDNIEIQTDLVTAGGAIQ